MSFILPGHGNITINLDRINPWIDINAFQRVNFELFRDDLSLLAKP
jgi:hypothetical protein